jgi:hypothetical protein
MTGRSEAAPGWKWAPDVNKQFKDLGVDSIRMHDTRGPTDIDAFQSGLRDGSIILWNAKGGRFAARPAFSLGVFY